MKPIFIIIFPITVDQQTYIDALASMKSLQEDYHLLTAIGNKVDFEFKCFNGNLEDTDIEKLKELLIPVVHGLN